MDGELYEAIATLARARTPFVVCTVVRTAGSTPRKAGAKLVVTADTMVGTIGGGRVEHETIEAARALLVAPSATLTTRTFHLTRDLAMCCGGEVDVLFEPVVPAETLVVYGGGHIARALVPMASAVGFDVYVAEDLEELTGAARFPTARGFFDGFELSDSRSVSCDARTYIVVVTRDHAIDQRICEQLLAAAVQPAFVGLIGSKRKSLMFRARLEQRGLEPARIATLRCPVGLDIGAQTPEEIAVAIVCELIQVRAERRARRLTLVEAQGGNG